MVYTRNMPVGESPVQLRNTKTEDRHKKKPLIMSGFFLIICYVSSRQTECIFSSYIYFWHDTPKYYISSSDSPENNFYLYKFVFFVFYNCDEPPVFYFFHGVRSVGFFPANGAPLFSIFLDCPRFFNNIGSKF